MTIGTTQYALIEGRKIGYRKLGGGPPLLLINRFRGTLDTWDPLFLEHLAKAHTVVTFDYPGIGYSEGELPLDATEVASEVVRVIEALELGRPSILGWSYGGLIAQYVAFLHPESIDKAVLVGTNPPGKNEVPMEPIFGQVALKPEYDLEDYTTLFFEPKSDASRAQAKASMDRIWPNVDHAKVPKTMDVFQRYMAGMKGVAMGGEDLRKQYATTTVPLLMISGDHDISFAVENWFPLVKHAPTLQMILFPVAGHGSFFQYPKVSAAHISAFLQS